MLFRSCLICFPVTIGAPIDAASMLLTSWFGSEKDKTDLRMKLIGQGKQFEASIYLPESERSVNSPVIIQASDELKKKAKEILNGRSLSELFPVKLFVIE